MSIDTLPKNGEYEQKPPVLVYEAYRELCDTTLPDVYRKTGISSAEDYEAASNSDSTVYVEWDGWRIPLFAPLEHAGGYNVEGTKNLTGKENLYALSLPLELLDEAGVDLDAKLTELGDDAAVIVQTLSSDTEEVQSSLTEKFGENGWAPHNFTNPDTNLPPENRNARISIYEAKFEAQDESGQVIPYRGLTVRELFAEEQEAHPQYETEVIDAAAIRADDALFEQLWELHDDKFGWLGQHHPVSMQESKGFFKSVVENDHTISIIRFDTDEEGNRVPVCHGCFMDNLEAVDWVNDSFADKIVSESEGDDENIIFFYGITSKSSPGKTMHYARDIMSLNSRMVQKGGGKTRLMFESTEISSLYIPRLVEDYIREEPLGVTMTEAVKPLSQVDYWFLASDSSETV